MDRKCSGTDWLGGLRQRKKYGPIFSRKTGPGRIVGPEHRRLHFTYLLTDEV